MERQRIILELKELIGNYLKGQGVELVELIYHYEGKNIFLRLLVDKLQGGISLRECAHFNNEISRILDEKDILKESYILEVSSPGLDRPLVTKNDFLRCINRRVKLILCESINGKKELEGIVTQVGDDEVYIEINGKCLHIPFSSIAKAKQMINDISE